MDRNLKQLGNVWGLTNPERLKELLEMCGNVFEPDQQITEDADFEVVAPKQIDNPTS